MTTQEIIDALASETGRFPREALLEAPLHREELIPHLLGALDNVCDNAEKIIAETPSYDLHFYALFLLAQFREKRAFPKMIRLLKMDEETLDYFLGETLTEVGSRCLCSVYDGNLTLLKELIEDENAYDFSRDAGIRAYGCLTRGDPVARDEMINYWRGLIHERLGNDTSSVPSIVSSFIIDEHLFELIPDVKFLYDREVIDFTFHGNYDGFIDSIFSYALDRDDIFIDDTVKELEHWAKYDKPRPAPKQLEQKPPRIALPEKSKKKIGRNDPCPCGSGKKYKKCCLQLGIRFNENKEEEEAPDESSQMNFFRELVGMYDNTKPYDLLQDYPSREPYPKDEKDKEKRTITEFYSPRAIEIDIPVYKALCHRSIPLWIKRNTAGEDLERIDFLLEAFAMFTHTCEEEGLETFADFDRKYMVHYESAAWVGALSALFGKYSKSISAEKLRMREAVNAALARMKHPA
jgi:hypothetical protein